MGLKCGPTTSEEDLKIYYKINPENEAGKLTLIARFGAGNVGDHLPRLIKAVSKKVQMLFGVAMPCMETLLSLLLGIKHVHLKVF